MMFKLLRLIRFAILSLQNSYVIHTAEISQASHLFIEMPSHMKPEQVMDLCKTYQEQTGLKTIPVFGEFKLVNAVCGCSNAKLINAFEYSVDKPDE